MDQKQLSIVDLLIDGESIHLEVDIIKSEDDKVVIKLQKCIATDNTGKIVEHDEKFYKKVLENHIKTINTRDKKIIFANRAVRKRAPRPSDVARSELKGILTITRTPDGYYMTVRDGNPFKLFSLTALEECEEAKSVIRGYLLNNIPFKFDGVPKDIDDNWLRVKRSK